MGKSAGKKIRLMPGIIIVIIQWLLWSVVPRISSGPMALMISVFGVLLGGLAIFIWWGFFSRASLFERWGGVIIMIAALAAFSQFLHPSIATGMQGMMYFAYAIPVLCLAFVVWAILFRNVSVKSRTVIMVLTIIFASGFWILLRSAGMTGDAGIYVKWRWAATAEQQLLNLATEEFTALPEQMPALDQAPEWPGFRGSQRNSVIKGIIISTDWQASPPKEVWRRPVGPGCSSFAVWGSLIYTQEQRGEEEVVSCYNLVNGKAVWMHKDKARFWDSHAGAGPRGTPTLFNGRVYTLGATGILNVLNAEDGSVFWARNVVTDTGVKMPGWGVSSSPLIHNGLVIIGAVGKIIAYDLTTGEPRWSGTDGGEGYSSPQIFNICGLEQVLFNNKSGTHAFLPDDGTLIWSHLWDESRITQPILATENDLIISAGGTKGIRRIAVKKVQDNWEIKELYTSKKLIPNHYDSILHKGYVYGFIGPNLACMDAATGARKWKGGRYGGQLLLFADQDLLLVLSEKGKLALVKAIPDQFAEVAVFPAIKGKTWNHPVLAGNILLVRNTSEMAAFRLPADEEQ